MWGSYTYVWIEFGYFLIFIWLLHQQKNLEGKGEFVPFPKCGPFSITAYQPSKANVPNLFATGTGFMEDGGRQEQKAELRG